MKIIKLTCSVTKSPIWVNPAWIVAISKASNGDTMVDTNCHEVNGFRVQESAEEVIRLIHSPKESLRRTDGKLEIIGGSPGLTIHCEADIKRIQELEAELAVYKRALQYEKDFSGKLRGQLNVWKDAANIRSSVKISSPDDLGKRIAELESQLKAWQEAASVDLFGKPDEPPTPCETPEQLIHRLRHLYRWATQAEKDASELRKPMNEIIGIATKVPPF